MVPNGRKKDELGAVGMEEKSVGREISALSIRMARNVKLHYPQNPIAPIAGITNERV